MSSDHAFGVFKPVGHVVISFPTAAQADAAAEAMRAAGLEPDALRRLTDREMLAQIDLDLAQATALASLGQELNLIKAHRVLAEQGFHWLIVRSHDDEQSAQVADVARGHGAERAQAYGRFLIEELISHAEDAPQVAESPDRGLDARTP